MCGSLYKQPTSVATTYIHSHSPHIMNMAVIRVRYALHEGIYIYGTPSQNCQSEVYISGSTAIRVPPSLSLSLSLSLDPYCSH